MVSLFFIVRSSAQCVIQFGTAKPIRINRNDWIRSILIKIESAIVPNRILMNKPPDIRIVVPKPVVMQPRLHIMPLPLEPAYAISSGT